MLSQKGDVRLLIGRSNARSSRMDPMIKRGFLFLVSGETIYALYLLTPYFKEALNVSNGLIDLTVLFFVLSLVAAFVKVTRKPQIGKPLLISLYVYAWFIVYVLINHFYVPNESVIYANDKLMRFLVFTTWSFFGVFIFIDNRQSLKKFLLGVTLISLLSCAVSLGEFKSFYGGVVLNNYLAVGRIAGMGLIILLAAYPYDESVKHKRLVALGAVALMGFIALSGSRMPLISAIVSILILVVTRIKLNWQKRDIRIDTGTKTILKIIGLVVLLSMPLYLSGYFDGTIKRMTTLGEIEKGYDPTGRLYRYQVAMNMWKEHKWFGAGFGSFPIYYNSKDVAGYPHNIFLEVGSELGIIGFLFLIFFLIFAFVQSVGVYRKKFGKLDHYQTCIVILLIFWILNSTTGLDLNGNRMLFTLIALCWFSPYLNDQEETSLQINRKIGWEKIGIHFQNDNNRFKVLT